MHRTSKERLRRKGELNYKLITTIYVAGSKILKVKYAGGDYSNLDRTLMCHLQRLGRFFSTKLPHRILYHQGKWLPKSKPKLLQYK